jgi:hypothetical protein
LLLALGVADAIAFALELRKKERPLSRAARVEGVGLVFLIALGLVDWKVYAIESRRERLLEHASLDRTISSDDRPSVVEELRRAPSRIAIECLGQSSRETASYCDAVDAVFRESGWDVLRGNTGLVASVGAPPISGTRISWVGGSRPASFDVVQHALSKLGDDPEVDPSRDGNGPMGIVKVVIAQKPGI